MSLWQLILRGLRQRSLSSFLTGLSVALGVMLVTGILLLQDEMERHFREPGRGYQLVVGAPGSALQLVLNSIYHIDKSPGLMPMSVWYELEENDSVAMALPYAVGDSFRGYRVVATTDELFSARFPHPEGEGQDKLAEGRPFTFDRAALEETLDRLGASYRPGDVPGEHDADEAHDEDAHDEDDDHDDHGGVDHGNVEHYEDADAHHEGAGESEHHDDDAHHDGEDVDAHADEADHADEGEHADEDEDGDHHDEDGDHHDEDGDHHDEDGDHHDEDGDHHDEDGDHHDEDGDHHDEDGDHHDEDGDHHDEDGDHHDEDGDHHDEDGDHHDEDGDHHDEDAHHHDHDHEGVREAVIGWEVARALHVTVGAEIEPTHGVEGGAAHEHEHFWTVVGILKETGTPVDKVVFINLDSFFAIEEHALGAMIPETNEAALSSLVLFPRPGVHKVMLLSGLNRRPDIQVADVQEQVANLFSIVGSVDVLFLLVSILVVIIGVLSILVAIYNSMSERRRELAILRAIGASRRVVFSVIVGEALLLTAIGGVVGQLLGHGLVAAVAARVDAVAGFRPAAFTYLPVEALVLGMVIVLGALAGLLPAWKAYQSDVARNLRPLS